MSTSLMRFPATEADSPPVSEVTFDHPRRRLGLHHLAFYRGHFDGIDLKTLGVRYLETGADLVKAKATLRWIRDELIAAARKHKPALVKVLAIPYGRLTDSTGGRDAIPPMRLEDFQAERDPGGFYTEAELVTLFEQEYSLADPVALRKARRNARLRKKVREAIDWLAGWVAVPPNPKDSVFVWLEEASARRLFAFGLATLDDLVRWITKRGKHWHRKIDKFGPVQAARIEYWLRSLTLLPNADLPIPVKAHHSTTFEAAIVPLERLMLPGDLSGGMGSNRAYGTTLAAPDDLAAINAWLSSLGPRPATVRSYRKEAERFLLWMLFERGKPLSSATTEDCISYRDFLNALDGLTLWYWHLPKERWIGARSTPRWSEDWRPFAGRLAPGSQKLAVTVLTALCEWLMRQRYLQSNPWDGVPPAHNVAPKIRADHSLTLAQWQQVLATCEDLPKDEAYFRLRFVLLFAYGCGLRLSELAGAVISSDREIPGVVNFGLGEVKGDWEITVLGKGQKPRTVPVPIQTMAALQDYLAARGQGTDVHGWKSGTPLIATLGVGHQYVHLERQALSTSALYRLLRTHFRRTAKDMPTAREAGQLLAASTHWLRHTHATHALEAGAAIEEVQENLGHASPATTAIYSHAGRKRRKSAVDKLMAFGMAIQDADAAVAP